MSHINDETTAETFDTFEMTQVAEVDSLTTTVNLMFLYSGGTYWLRVRVCVCVCAHTALAAASAEELMDAGYNI